MATETTLGEKPEFAPLVDRYRRDGYVHVPGVLTREEVDIFGAAVDHAVAVRKQGDDRSLEEKTPYEQSFIQCQYLWEDFPEVRPLTFHPVVCALAAGLIGAPTIRLWHDQALYKEAGGRETEAHQDQPYWPIAETATVTAWIPFVQTDETSGMMGYVPGSQHGEASFVDIFSSPGAGKALEAKQTKAPVFVPCQRGDVVFHSGLTVHMAKANRSEHTRRVYTVIYLADGLHRESERPHPSVDRDAIGPGEVIAGRATPIAWPLAGGAFPEPAPWPPWPAENAERRERLLRLGIIPVQPR
ncbi:MAG: phytanoyl-CoA dioxygenase family protein [Caulobacteraceae bacterium]